MSRKVKILGRAIPLPAAITGIAVAGAGVAVAAILLTTTISGQATVETVTTSNSVAITASSDNGSQLVCDVTASSDATSLVINPHLKKIAGGSNASGVPVPGGNCTINVSVTNTGDTPIHVDGSSAFSLPSGWSYSPIAGSALTAIAPHTSASLSTTISADGSAVPGPVTGKLVYSD